MADAVIEPAADICVQEVCKVLKYFFGYEGYINTLKGKCEGLKAQRGRVIYLFDEASRNGSTIFLTVHYFLEKSKKKLEKADILIGRSNCCCRYNDAKSADRLSKAIAELISDGRDITKENVGIDPIEILPERFGADYSPRRESYLEELKGALVGDSDQKHVIGVYGEKNAGKTTLVNKLAFDIGTSVPEFKGVVRMSCKLLQEKGVDYIQNVVAESLGIDMGKTITVEVRAYKISRILSVIKPKVLIILDDVEQKIDLTNIGIPMPSASCRIVVVSRSLRVCEMMKTHMNMEIGPFYQDKSSDLFDKLAEEDNFVVASGGSRVKTFMLDVDALTIEHGNNPEHWRMSRNLSTSSVEAKLIEVWYLTIRGIATEKWLWPATDYGVYLVYKLMPVAKGFKDSQVEFFVGSEYKSCFLDPSKAASLLKQKMIGDSDMPKPRADGWLEVEMGNFYNDGDSNSEVNLLVRNRNTEIVKSGLRIKGIELRPLKQI